MVNRYQTLYLSVATVYWTPQNDFFPNFCNKMNASLKNGRIFAISRFHQDLHLCILSCIIFPITFPICFSSVKNRFRCDSHDLRDELMLLVM